MASTGKKINELTALSTVTNETVLPAVYVEGLTVNSTAQKISISQISDKVQNDMTSVLQGKQDVLTAGNNITIEENVISATVPEGSYTRTNLLAGTNITITQDSSLDANTKAYFKFANSLKDIVTNSSNYEVDGFELQNTEQHFNSGTAIANTESHGAIGGSYLFNPELIVNNSNSFTVDYFAKFADTSSIAIADIGIATAPAGSSGNQYECAVSYIQGETTSIWSGCYESFSNANNVVTVSERTTIDTNWHHYAFVWDSSTSKLSCFMDGILCSYLLNPTFSRTGTIYNGFYISLRSTDACYIQGVRVSDVARWTTDFTVPTNFYDVGDPVYRINSTASGGGAPTITWYDTFSEGQTAVTISSTSGATLVKVYKNGLLMQPTADYSISGTTLTMVATLNPNDKIALEVFA